MPKAPSIRQFSLDAVVRGATPYSRTGSKSSRTVKSNGPDDTPPTPLRLEA